VQSSDLSESFAADVESLQAKAPSYQDVTLILARCLCVLDRERFDSHTSAGAALHGQGLHSIWRGGL
jgi:hypothetical protein